MSKRCGIGTLGRFMVEKKLALLVRRAIRGDIKAFEELYSERAQSVLFHVRNQIVDKENCQDVAQEVAIAMWKNIKQLRNPAAFKSWMYQVVRTTCADHNRKLLKEREQQKLDSGGEDMDELPAKITGEESDPALLTLKKDDEHRLFKAIEALPPVYRETIALRYYDDLSYKEIAEVLGVGTSAVGTNIMRATEHLKKALAEKGSAEHSSEVQEECMREETLGSNE